MVMEAKSCQIAFMLLLKYSYALMSRYSAEEIEEKVNTFRLMLQEKEEPSSNASERPA